MQRIVASLLLIATLAFAQSRKTVTSINGNLPGSITNTIVSTDDTAPVLYEFFVPENASSLRFTILNTNHADCSYIDGVIMQDVPPCQLGNFGLLDDNTFCALGYSGSWYSSSYTDELFVQPNDDDGYVQWEVGKPMYIGIRTDSAYVGETCTYIVGAEVNTSCGAGQVAHYNGSNSPSYTSCVSYTAISSLVNYTHFYNVNQTDYTAVFRFPVPQNTGNIHFNVQGSVDLDVSAKVNSGGSYSYSDCYDSGTNVDFYCIVPNSGYIYLTITPDDDSDVVFNYTLTTSIDVCTGTLVGYNCTFPSTQITNFNQTYTTSFNETSGFNSYNFRYYWFDAPAFFNNTNVQVNVAIQNTTNDDYAYVYFVKDNFPESNSDRTSIQYQTLSIGNPASWVYSFYDALGTPRNWIGIGCYSDVCNITLWFTYPSTTTTTTTTTTAAATTTTSTSSTAAAATTTTSTSAAATTTTSTSTSAAATTTTSSSTSSTASATTTTTTGNATTTTTTSTTGNRTTTTGNTTSSSTTAAAATTTSTTGSSTVLIASLVIIFVAALL